MMLTIGLDVGNGSIGLCVRDGDTLVQDTMPSVYGRVDLTRQVLSVPGKSTSREVDVFTFGGEHFVLGYEHVHAMHSTPIGAYDREQRYASRQFETLAKLALLDAATRTGRTGVIEVAVACGTPSEDFTTRTVEIMQRWFSEPITGAKNGEQVVVMIKRLEVIPQPFAVFLDAYLDQDGLVVDEGLEKQDVLVIDSGSGTLDLSEIHRLELTRQTSIPAGLNDVYQIILEEIRREEPKVYATAYDLEAQLRAQDGAQEFWFDYGAHRMNITELRERAMRQVWDRMQQGIQYAYPDRSSFGRVILAGGSGEAFRNYFLAWMPSIRIAPDPQLAVARGLYKYALAQEHEES
ncbi:ParM/StbA family protein [Alicyclobacillus vulcanalis]|uniref:Plasmid segregation protein ParM n=1 Tax=Alicyclobacillus vulcanalis TaxID=252246 RepID=A0A1N7PUY9_9BACL|nr:recombinase [Alicyclobacillus vulcanalis]SIT14370.1 plasmid segregation protein ParM [Alicyclobacillus vulcanalis]